MFIQLLPRPLNRPILPRKSPRSPSRRRRASGSRRGAGSGRQRAGSIFSWSEQESLLRFSSGPLVSRSQLTLPLYARYGVLSSGNGFLSASNCPSIPRRSNAFFLDQHTFHQNAGSGGSLMVTSIPVLLKSCSKHLQVAGPEDQLSDACCVAEHFEVRFPSLLPERLEHGKEL